MYRYQITLDARIAGRLWDIQDMAVQQGAARGWTDVSVEPGKVLFTSADKPAEVEAVLLRAFPRLAKGLTVARRPLPRARLMKGLYGLNDVPAVTDFG